MKAPGTKPKRIAAWISGTIFVLGLQAAVFWPSYTESLAKEKVITVLEGHFDFVEIGQFDLERDQLTLQDVRLEKAGLEVTIESVELKFDVGWIDREVRVSEVVARGGTVVGELDPEALKSNVIPQELASSNTSSKLVLEGARVQVEGIQVGIHYQGLGLRTELTASATTLAGPIELEAQELELLRDDDTRFFAVRTSTIISVQTLFPLTIVVEEAEATRGDLLAQGISGTLNMDSWDRFGADLQGETEEGQAWGLVGELNQGAGSLLLSATDIRPSQLPGAERLPLRDVGVLSGTLSLSGTEHQLKFNTHLQAEGVELEHPRIALHPVTLNHVVSASGVVNLDTRETTLERAGFRGLEDLGWELVVSGRMLPEEHLYELEIQLDEAPCQEVLEAIPQGLAPALEGFELSGTSSVDLQVALRMDDPEATVLEGIIDLDGCRLKEVPQTVAELSGPFSHTVKMRTGRPVTLLLGPGTTDYTPLEWMPSSILAAVVSTEDGGFWGHDGFLPAQFKASLKRNVELGKFSRGGSTITMQMVKNVLLTHERTLSRKFQELFLTWVVEQILSKQRILEVYLNVVEFGPGIYGITAAADYYFDKSPLELSSLESAFLASLLPKPLVRHAMFCRQALTPAHAKYIGKVHARMLSSGRIDQREFDEAASHPFTFGRRRWRGEAACLAEGREVAAGPYTQGALTGLQLGQP